MTYEYYCEPCDYRFDVIKPASEMERDEPCEKCQTQAARQFVPSRVYFSNTAVQHAEWNPAFGCVVKDKYHRGELAKANNVVEIGNDYKEPDRLHKEFDEKREQKRKESWDKV